MKIFWSWQDDYSPNRNRTFIKAALETAVSAISGDYDLEDAERPELDHDTKGVAGAIEIAPMLLKKIAESVVFVGDVTPIATTANGKALPNPNVMVELGWSLNKPGETRQIYVLNTADGWKVEDLPFDIRGRRVLTYSLSSGSDQATRDRKMEKLAEELAEALRINLDEHLDEQAAITPVTGVAANPDDPSLWASAGPQLSHQDSFAKGGVRYVTLRPGGRAFIRIIPSGWQDGPPDIAAVQRYDANLRVDALAEGTDGGNFGPSPEGFVQYWVTGDGDGQTLETANASMFFDETGEFWVIQGTAIGVANDHKGLRVHAVVGGWARALHRAHWFLDFFKAYPNRRVEVGVVGLDGVCWPSNWASQRRPSRKAAFKFDRTQRDWSTSAQESFLAQAYIGLCDVFAVDRPSAEEAAAFVEANDLDRGVTPPWL